MAVRNGYESIAFPVIATEEHGFPAELSAKIACKAVNDFLFDQHTRDKIRLIVFCVFGEAVELYEHTMRLYFPTGAHALARQ